MINRIEKIQKLLSKGQAALITSDANRFYLTGFHSSAGFVLITCDSADFFVDFRYFERAKSTVSDCTVTMSVNPREELKKLLSDYAVSELFVEVTSMSVADYNSYCSIYSKVHVSPDSLLDNALYELRSIKDAGEIARIKDAQKMTDDTFSYILERIAVGRTERDVMLDMEFYMRRMGSDGVSFDFIVVSGKNSSLPHGVPTDKVIERGDFITMDFGAVVDGYRSDMTRTVAVGKPNDEQCRVYQTVIDAQNAAFKKIAPGVICCDVDKSARNVISAAGYEGCFGHGLGHSVGIDIHENPCFNTRCQTPLCSGMIITVEPGIYLENRFGVRIEDMVLITDSGFDNLTASEKSLIIL